MKIDESALKAELSIWKATKSITQATRICEKLYNDLLPEPKELITPAVKVFILNWLAINNIAKSDVNYITFEFYYTSQTILINANGNNYSIDLLKKNGTLINEKLIDEDEYYTLEDLGIK